MVAILIFGLGAGLSILHGVDKILHPEVTRVYVEAQSFAAHRRLAAAVDSDDPAVVQDY